MAENPGLTKAQQSAIAFLADGMTQGDTAQRLGVTRKTVNQWCNRIPEFAAELQAEIERRQARIQEQYQRAVDEVQDETIAQFKLDLQEYQNALRQAHRARISRGLKLLHKVGKRFDDLPEEAISIRDIAGLVMASDRLLERGFEGWAESLSLVELLQKLENGEI